MRTCPTCKSPRIYASRARSVLERIRMIVTGRQPYRCHECEWRGWAAIVLPIADHSEATAADLRTGVTGRAVTQDELDRIDR